MERLPSQVKDGRVPYCSKRHRALAQVELNRERARLCHERTPRMSLEDRFWSKVQCGDGCWLWTKSVGRKGYGEFSSGGKHGGSRLAHRVAWELTFGPIPDGLWVLHRCDNPPCVRPDHLFLGDVLANNRDMWSKGRARPSSVLPRGERHAHHKLTEAIVREARRRHAGGETNAWLAHEFKVSTSTMLAALKRKTWQHVA